jgi:hypothetical protein
MSPKAILMKEAIGGKMKGRYIFCRFLFMLATISIAGCVGKPVATVTATVVPTRIPTLTPTSTPTPEPTLTPSPSPSPTPTSIPSLPPDEARLLFLDLLANNGNCHLPCFWGITPGVSSFQEAQAKLTPLGSIAELEFNPGTGEIFVSSVNEESDLTFIYRLVVLTQPGGDTIRFIGFSGFTVRYRADGGYDNVYDSDIFEKQVAFYDLAHVLSENGKPEAVLLQTASRPDQFGNLFDFIVVLLYPNQGIFAVYTTPMGMSGDYVLGCIKNSKVVVDLYPSGIISEGDVDSFIALIGSGWQDRLRHFKSLEEATSMTLDEFYETFSKPTDACIKTPSNIWPDPDY